MQDIYMKPLKHVNTFKDYVDLFWHVKIKWSIKKLKNVAIVFDAQERHYLSTKDATRKSRDDKVCDYGADIEVDHTQTIPHGDDWDRFLRNRTNKRALVRYLVGNLKQYNDKLKLGELLILSAEESVFQITDVGTTEVVTLKNNHEEADTRMLMLAKYY